MFIEAYYDKQGDIAWKTFSELELSGFVHPSIFVDLNRNMSSVYRYVCFHWHLELCLVPLSISSCNFRVISRNVGDIFCQSRSQGLSSSRGEAEVDFLFVFQGFKAINTYIYILFCSYNRLFVSFVRALGSGAFSIDILRANVIIVNTMYKFLIQITYLLKVVTVQKRLHSQ